MSSCGGKMGNAAENTEKGIDIYFSHYYFVLSQICINFATKSADYRRQTIENKTLSNVKKCGLMNSEIRLYISDI